MFLKIVGDGKEASKAMGSNVPRKTGDVMPITTKKSEMKRLAVVRPDLFVWCDEKGKELVTHANKENKMLKPTSKTKKKEKTKKLW